MKKYLIALIAVLIPSISLADTSISVGYASSSGTIKNGNTSVDADSDGFSIGGRIDLTESFFLSLASTSVKNTLSGALNGNFENLVTEYGVGYYLSNSLNRSAGAGGYLGVGVAVSNVEITIGSTSEKSNSESIYGTAGVALGSGLVGTLDFSAQSSGKSMATEVGFEYSLSDEFALSVAYRSSNSKAGNLSTDLNGYTLAIIVGL